MTMATTAQIKNHLNVKLTSMLLTLMVPRIALANRPVNGVQKCEQGGIMKIVGFNGLVSAPKVTFKGVTYSMRPYTPVGANYLTFVDNGHTGSSLGVGSKVFLVVERHGKVTDRCNALP